MRDTQASRTAHQVALMRGLGSLLPPEAQLVDDPWGATWTGNDRWRRLAQAAPPVLRAVTRPGWPWLLYMQVRTFALDEAVRRFVTAGGRQLVILGAGLDARAVRLKSLGLRVFEVDHPATQAEKRGLIGDASTLVEWDFEKNPLRELPDKLASSGLRRDEPVCVIWEGVTMYLTEAAIDETFSMLRTLFVPDSVLAFTYFDRARLDRPSLGVRLLARRVARGGEPWRFGWHPGELPGWLAKRGFALQSDEDAATLAKAWMPGAIAARMKADGRRIAVATLATAKGA